MGAHLIILSTSVYVGFFSIIKHEKKSRVAKSHAYRVRQVT